MAGKRHVEVPSRGRRACGHAVVVVSKGAAVCAVIQLALVSSVQAQALSIPNGATEAEIVALAEAEGAAHAAVASSDVIARKCVAADGSSQSGEFTLTSKAFTGGGIVAHQRTSLHWIPAYYEVDKIPLVVRARNLAASRDTLVLTDAVPIEVYRGPRHAPTQKYLLFAAGMTFPSPGRWLVIGATGTNWGCFLITVT